MGNPNAEKLKTKLVVTKHGSNPKPNNRLPSLNGFLLHPRIYITTTYVKRNHFLMTRYFSPHIPWLALCIPVDWISGQLEATANISAGTLVLAFLHSNNTTTNVTTLNFALKKITHKTLTLEITSTMAHAQMEKDSHITRNASHILYTSFNTSLEGHLKRTMK